MRDPTIVEVNAEIRKIKRAMKGNIDTRNGLKFLVPDCEFISEVGKMIEDQKEIIKCLERIKERLI